MIDSVKIEPHGGAFGLFRLMFWNRSECCYMFPSFVENMTLRICESSQRMSSKVDCRVSSSPVAFCEYSVLRPHS